MTFYSSHAIVLVFVSARFLTDSIKEMVSKYSTNYAQ